MRGGGILAGPGERGGDRHHHDVRREHDQLEPPHVDAEVARLLLAEPGGIDEPAGSGVAEEVRT